MFVRMIKKAEPAICVLQLIHARLSASEKEIPGMHKLAVGGSGASAASHGLRRKHNFLFMPPSNDLVLKTRTPVTRLAARPAQYGKEDKRQEWACLFGHVEHGVVVHRGCKSKGR